MSRINESISRIADTSRWLGEWLREHWIYDRLQRVVGAIAISDLTGMVTTFAGGALMTLVFFAICNSLLRVPVLHSFFAAGSSKSRQFTYPLTEQKDQPGSIRIIRTFVDDLADGFEPVLDRANYVGETQFETEPGSCLHFTSYRVQVATEVSAGEETRNEYRPFMLVEIRLESDGRSEYVVADIGMQQGGEWKRIPWWQSNGLARSNRLAETSSYWWVLRSLRYDASPSSISTWVKSYWNRTTKELLGDTAEAEQAFIKLKKVKEVLAPELERLVGNDFGHLQKAGPIAMQRILNGPIQFLTVMAFFSAIIVLAARWQVIVRDEMRYSLGIDDSERTNGSLEDSSNWYLKEIERIEKEVENHQDRWGPRVTSATLNIWLGALSAIRLRNNYSDVPAFLDSYANLEQERIDSSAYLLRFLVASMPALGFIGTVLGIGDALMGTGAVLSDELAKQQSGVSTVALSLGFAFDTTFVALLLSLITMYLMSMLSAGEESVLQSARSICLDVFVSGGSAPTFAGRTVPDTFSDARTQRRLTQEFRQQLESDSLETQPAPPDDEKTPRRESGIRDESSYYRKAADQYRQSIGVTRKLVVVGGIFAFALYLGIRTLIQFFPGLLENMP